MNTLKKYIGIVESLTEAYRVKLPYETDGLAPVLSQDAIEMHYGVLHNNYVTRANSGDTSEFVIAGVVLHNLFFEQLKESTLDNLPTGKVTELIRDFDEFKEKFNSTAKSIQGSGWCFMDSKGNIDTIPNHEHRDDIVLIIDMWEHSWVLDYAADKNEYLNNMWSIIDWDVINSRL